MKRAPDHFTDDDRKSIAAAVTAAESRCAAEIVPVVATDSGRYDRAEDLVGLTVALGAFVLAWLFFQAEDYAATGWDETGLPVTLQLPALVAILLGGFFAGALLATRIAWLRRLFTPSAEMTAEVAARASQLFFDHRIHHTAAEAGVMVFVSLYERRAVVLADRVAFEHLGQEKVDEICDSLTATLRAEGITAALVAAIGRIGDALAEPLPRTTADASPLDDALVTLP